MALAVNYVILKVPVPDNTLACFIEPVIARELAACIKLFFCLHWWQHHFQESFNIRYDFFDQDSLQMPHLPTIWLLCLSLLSMLGNFFVWSRYLIILTNHFHLTLILLLRDKLWLGLCLVLLVYMKIILVLSLYGTAPCFDFNCINFIEWRWTLLIQDTWMEMIQPWSSHNLPYRSWLILLVSNQVSCQDTHGILL